MYEPVEPRIDAIKGELERILSLVEFERNGQPLRVDGFRLRNLRDWQTGIAESPLDVLGPLSGLCNAHCVFCMERGIPFDRDYSFLSHAEARTRLKSYHPQTGSCLFPSARPHMESLLNPESVQILESARAISPGELFILTTNGTTLTEERIQALASLRPILLKLSVNASATADRNRQMGLREPPDRILGVMALLRQYRIPFVGSVVVWPDVSCGDLWRTIVDIARFEPYGIRIRLPLHHKYMTTPPSQDMMAFWETTADFVKTRKSALSVPVWTEPVQYGRTPLLPILDGVILHSPAFEAGLREGDVLLTLNGREVPTRMDVRKVFVSGELDTLPSLSLQVGRGGEILTLSLHRTDILATGEAAPGASRDKPGRYPHDPDLHHPGERFGLLFLPDFDLQYLDNILQAIQAHDAKKILLFCSPLTAGTVEELLDQIPLCQAFFKERELWICALDQTWMEGNTQLTDSRFVSDYEAHVRRFMEQTRERPDLLLIPDCFGSSWGIDLLGTSVYRIESRTGIPVARIPWHLTYGKED